MKVAKKNIAIKINTFTYQEFLERSVEISRMISNELSKQYSEEFYCDVGPGEEKEFNEQAAFVHHGAHYPGRKAFEDPDE